MKPSISQCRTAALYRADHERGRNLRQTATVHPISNAALRHGRCSLFRSFRPVGVSVRASTALIVSPSRPKKISKPSTHETRSPKRMEVLSLFTMIVRLMCLGRFRLPSASGPLVVVFLLCCPTSSLAPTRQTVLQAMAGHLTLLAIPFFGSWRLPSCDRGVAKRIHPFSLSRWSGGISRWSGECGVLCCMLFGLSGPSPAQSVASVHS